MPPWARPGPDGCTLTVRVVPRSPRTGVEAGDETVVVRVRAAPERGRATEEAVRRLAEVLRVAPSRIALRSGPRSRAKVFSIAGLTAREAARRLTGRGSRA
ncbi:MAG TPA: DUF167 domain-containing protein [Actinomycetota bacterium]|nr:DUF167 domain-containing protein [Actinomycetota bacterium]